MTKNERLSKPMKHKTALLEDCFKFKNSLIESLKRENLSSTLDGAYQKAIASNMHSISKKERILSSEERECEANLKEELHTMQSLVAKGDENDVRFRELLLMSEGGCIEKFSELKTQFDSSFESQADYLNYHFNLEWSLSLETILKYFTQNALDSLQSKPNIDDRSIKNIDLTLSQYFDEREIYVNCKNMETRGKHERGNSSWSSENELIETRHTENKWLCWFLKTTKSTPRRKQVVLSNCAAETFLFKDGYLAICQKDGTVFVLSLDTQRFVEKINLEPNSIPLALARWSSGTFSCLVWNSGQHYIEFPAISCSRGPLSLPAKPDFVKSFRDVYSILQPEATVIVWDSKKNIDLCITNLQHGLSSIGNMALQSEDTLFLFDYKLGLIVKFKVDLLPDLSRKCTMEKVLKISAFSDQPVKFMTVAANRLIAYSNSKEIYSAEIPQDDM